MPQAIGILVAIGASSLGVSTGTGLAIGAAVAAFAPVAILVGLSLAASLLFRPRPPKPSDGLLEFQQAVPSRLFHYGRVKVGGPLAFYEAREDEDTFYSAWKIILHSSRQIDAVEAHYLNDFVVTMDVDNFVEQSQYILGGIPRVRLITYAGTDSQTSDPILQAVFDEWTTDHRLRGIAYSIAQFRQFGGDKGPIRHSHIYPNGEPKLTVLLRGNLVLDPRDDSTAWSELAGLAVLDWLTHSDGYDRPLAKMDLASFEDFADLCDEDVPLRFGGDEKRYTIAATCYLNEKRSDVLARLREACDADLYPTADGKIAIRGGQWTEPTVTIDHGLGHIYEADLSNGVDALQRYNELALQYMSPPHGYTEVEGEPWQNTADPDFIAGRIETRPLDLLQVPSFAQARRLAKIRMAHDNPEWIGTLRTNFYGLNCIGERVFTLVFPELGIDGPFYIDEMQFDGTGVTMKVRSADPDAYEWDADTEEGTAPPVPEDTSEEPPTGLPIDPVTNLNAVGGSGQVTITFKTPNEPHFENTIVWRAASGGGFGTATDVSGPLYGSPNQSMSFVDTPVTAGSFDYFVTAVSTVGISSTATGPDAATVT